MSAVYNRQRPEMREREAATPSVLHIEAPRALLTEGAMFGRYQVVRRIGSGGTAEVYEANHLGLKKRVALKVLRSEHSGRQEVRARFLREAELAARIQHPNVIDIIDVGACEGIPFIVMEYLEGETLAELLRRQTRLDVQHAVHIMLPVLAAVAAGHERGVIHRDLKPGNIFLAADGRRRTLPKVLDFGVSGVISEGGEAISDAGVIGTPYYMSTEQARGDRNLDARTDQFALGVILYEAITGRSPWKSQSVLGLIHEVGKGEFSSPRRHRPELDPELEAVILKAMRRNAQERFESTRAMGVALLAFGSIRAREYWAVELGNAAARASATNEASFHAPVSEAFPLQAAQLRASDAAPLAAALVPHAAAPATPSVPPYSGVPLYTPRPPRRYGRMMGSVAVLLLAAGAAALALRMRATGGPGAAPEMAAAAPATPAAPTTYDCSTQVQPASARVELDGKSVGEGTFQARLPIDGATHTIRLEAQGFEPMTLTFRDAPPPAQVELQAATPPTPPTPATPQPAAARPVVPGPLPPRPAAGGPWPRAAVPSKAHPPSAPSAAAPTAEPTTAPQTWPVKAGTDNRDPWSK